MTTTIGKSKDIMFLLGAGASVEAGIPASGMMIDQIEDLLLTSSDWKDFYTLYCHIKSAIHYSAGLRGLFGNKVTYNIETLVNTLYELERNESHPLFPFIAAWNSRFVDLAGRDFGKIRQFRRLILRQLKNWILLENPAKAAYYGGLRKLQGGLNFSLRVFSLNYDLCVEQLNSSEFQVETGFENIGPWDWERFEDTDGGPPPAHLYLYKLHGSINWKRDETKALYCPAHTENIKPEDMEVIFGRDFKLEAADPYLFYAYEFRRFSLDAKVIVVVGYGFGDEHINKILTQALNDTEDRRLLVVANCDDDTSLKAKQQDVCRILVSVPPSHLV